MKVGDIMDIIVQKFITEVNQRFAFLKEYGYQKVECKVKSQDYYPDSEAVVKYISKTVGIEVYWYFAGANIGVVFFELQNGKIPAKMIFFGETNNASRAINLYTIARYYNKLEDKDFLLNDVDNVTIAKIRIREKIIRENMPGIINGLSNAVNKLAKNIIVGDTSIFKEIMNYQSKIIKKDI